MTFDDNPSLVEQSGIHGHQLKSTETIRLHFYFPKKGIGSNFILKFGHIWSLRCLVLVAGFGLIKVPDFTYSS